MGLHGSRTARLHAACVLALGVTIVARHFLWAHVNPMFMGPDEEQHVLMAAAMDHYGLAFYRDRAQPPWKELVRSSDRSMDYYRESGVIGNPAARQPFAPAARWAQGEQERLHVRHFDEEVEQHMILATYRYPPLYYGTVGLLLRFLRRAAVPLIDYQFAIRLFGILFYGAWLFFIYSTCRAIAGKEIAILGTFVLASHPMPTYLAAVANPEIAVLASAAALFHGVAGVLRDGHKAAWGFTVVGALLAPAAKGQGTMLSVIGLAVLAILLLRRKRYRGAAGAALVSILVLSEHHLLRLVTGELVMNAGGKTDGTLASYLRVLGGVGHWLIYNTLGEFAWFEVKFSSSTYTAFAFVIALLVLVTARVSADIRDRRGDFARFGLLCFSLFWLAMLVVQYLWMPTVGYVIQGRYALCVFPLVFLAAVAVTTHERAIIREVFVLALAGIGIWFAILNVRALWMLVERFYDAQRGDVLLQLMQYKPTYFKSKLVIMGSVSIYAIALAATATAGCVLWRRAATEGSSPDRSHP
jgi:hypothetical protein